MHMQNIIFITIKLNSKDKICKYKKIIKITIRSRKEKKKSDQTYVYKIRLITAATISAVIDVFHSL